MTETALPRPAPRATMRSLLVLAWPIVLARATQSVIGFCDALMVAPLGEAPLAAVTTGSLNAFALIILPMGITFIVQSFAAQLRGRGDLLAAQRYAWYGLGLAATAGLAALVAALGIPGAVSLFDYSPEVASFLSAYLMIRMLSVAPAVATEALGNWYGGLGNTRPAMVAGVVTMVANVAGNFLLIEPRFGLPGFGVVGAAWASVIASWLGSGVILYGFLTGAGYDRGRGPGKLRFHELARMIRFGLPNGINWFLEFAAFAVFINAVVAHLGTTALAAFNVVIQINSISFMPAFGMASAGAILVGEAIGRGAHDRVWHIVKLTGLANMAWMGSVGLGYLVAPGVFMGWFRPRGVPAEALVAVGATMLMLSALWQIFDAVGMTLSEALRAAGDTTWPMMARVVLAWAFFTPAAWVAVRLLDGGVVAVMVSVISYLALLAGALGFRFATGRWRTIDLVGKEPVVAAPVP